MTESNTDDGAALATAPEAEETAEQLWASMNQDDDDTGGDDGDQGDGGDDGASDDFDDADWKADGDDTPDDTPAKGGSPADTTPDIWANATPEQRRELERLQERDRRTRGQVSATAKKMNELRERLAALDSDESDAELERLNEDYPDVAGPLIRTQSQVRDAVRALSEAEGIRIDEANALYTEQLEDQRAAVEAAHPEWQTVIGENVDTFRSWTQDQPKAIRDAVEANMDDVFDPDSLSNVLTSFKAYLAAEAQTNPVSGDSAQTKTLSARRQRQLEGAKSIAGQSRQTTAASTASDNDPEAIWNELQEQEAREARRNRG